MSHAFRVCNNEEKPYLAHLQLYSRTGNVLVILNVYVRFGAVWKQDIHRTKIYPVHCIIYAANMKRMDRIVHESRFKIPQKFIQRNYFVQAHRNIPGMYFE